MKKPQKPKKPRLVEIDWTDSCSCAGWKNPDEIREWTKTLPSLLASGYLISSTRGQVTIASAFDPTSGTASTFFQIPKQCVKRIRRLK